MRIENHPIIEYDKGDKIRFLFNGKEIDGYTNETIAAALIAAGVKTFSHSSRAHKPMGLFCGIGNCSSCMMRVDGVENVRVCVTMCKDGMIVETQS